MRNPSSVGERCVIRKLLFHNDAHQFPRNHTIFLRSVSQQLRSFTLSSASSGKNGVIWRRRYYDAAAACR